MKGGLGGSLPIQASDVAASWDAIYSFLFYISVFFFVLVIGIMVYFAIKYRKGRPGKVKQISHNVPLEIAWTVIPTVLLLFIFGWGWVVYRDMITTPPNAMEVRVIGKQWSWSFQYEDGRVTTAEVFVPALKPVKFIMTSSDVLHSVFIPDFRVKQDVVPGMVTTLWFEGKRPGTHQIYCTEYCGKDHSGMLAKVHVLDAKNWKLFERGKPVQLASMGSAKSPERKAASLVDQGRNLMQKHGCVACHSSDGSQKIGPSYKGRFGQLVDLEDGTKVKVTENYIRESILNPRMKVVKGFNPVMPTFKGLVSEQELNAFVSYIKSLK